MLLRSMTPDVLAMDEITANSDSDVVMEASECGAGLLTTVHGEGVNVLHKPGFRKILHAGVFRYGIVIDVGGGKRVYKVVDLYDEAVRRDTHIDSRRNARSNASILDERKDGYS